jgi:hypothetical protein
MKRFEKTPLLLTFLVLAAGAGSVSAQGSDTWEFQLAPLYLWAVDMGGTMTVMGEETPFEIKFADAAENLEATFTVHFEAWKGDWGLLADVSWLDLGGEMPLPVPLPDTEPVVEIEFQQTMVELGAFYRFATNTSIIFGARYTSLDPKVTLPMEAVIDPSQSWTDAFLGLVWRPQISKRWTFAGRFDIAAGGSNVTYNASAILDWQIGRFLALDFGYRYLDTDYEDSGAGFAYDATQQGPLVALRFFW